MKQCTSIKDRTMFFQRRLEIRNQSPKYLKISEKRALSISNTSLCYASHLHGFSISVVIANSIQLRPSNLIWIFKKRKYMKISNLELTKRKKTTTVNAQIPPRRMWRPFLAVFCRRRGVGQLNHGKSSN